jgi:hypothetical protein
LAREALASIDASTYRKVEVVLVNDGGVPPGVPDSFALPVVKVNLGENQGRALAANAGLEAASGEYLCFLDDDDLWEPEHLTTLVGLVSAPGVQVAYTDAAVGVYELASRGGWQMVERRLPYSRDFDPHLLLLDNYIPFNTVLMPRELVLEAGAFEPTLTFFEDWDFLIRLAALAPFSHLAQVTCEYRHFRQEGHHILGESPDQREDFLTMKARVVARHQERMTPEILSRAVAGLRQDVVAAQEARASAARELRESRARWLVQEQDFHALRGENQALKGALDDLSQQKEKADLELERLYGEEGRLNRAVADLLSDKDRLAARVADLEQGLVQRALRKIRG